MPACIDVFLPPGGTFAGDARHRVRTLLGSCVSITLWHPQRRLGAMSHFLLAQRGPCRHAREVPPADALDARYGDEALKLMFAALAAQGVDGRDCEAKLFGGGNMFPHYPTQGPAVGRRNGAAARALLAAQGVVPVSQSLFGIGHRSIVFDIATGDVWSRGGETSMTLPHARPVALAAFGAGQQPPRPRTGVER